MKRIAIKTGGARYAAIIGRGLLARIGQEIGALLPGPKCAVVADANTAALYGNVVVESLRNARFVPALITIPVGEGSKSLERAGVLCDEMTATGLDRTSFVVALGGGVVGDLAGFAAAIYHRGIPHVQVPTTLLAQVDSSIGGKTAVNTAAGKNLLGAVHQPALVVADVATLDTLPAREFNQGMAEVIKHGIIADAALFEMLGRFQREALAELVARNVAIKAAIVAQDERDATGTRAILNFGHTVGHAIERAGGYGWFLHGEAISLGIVAACEVSVQRAGMPETDRKKVITMLKAFELPVKLPTNFPREAILPAMQSDKKFERGAVRFVVSGGLGSAYLSSEITIADIENAVAKL